MDDIPDYVPLRINDMALFTNVEKQEIDSKYASTITGSIIKRTRSKLPIAIGTNAFRLMIDHINEMNAWFVYAPLREKLNGVLGSNLVKKIVENNNRGLYSHLLDSYRVAVGTYRGHDNAYGKLLIDVHSSLAASNIAFRIWTALKQILSVPVFITYDSSLRFKSIFARQLFPTKWHSNFKWAIENLPSMRERWEGRMVGNEKLAQSSW